MFQLNFVKISIYKEDHLYIQDIETMQITQIKQLRDLLEVQSVQIFFSFHFHPSFKKHEWQNILAPIKYYEVFVKKNTMKYYFHYYHFLLFVLFCFDLRGIIFYFLFTRSFNILYWSCGRYSCNVQTSDYSQAHRRLQVPF